MEFLLRCRAAQLAKQPAPKQKAYPVAVRSRNKVCGTAKRAARLEVTTPGCVPGSAHEVPGRITVAQSAADSTSPSNSGALADEMRILPGNQVADTLWAFVMTHGYDPATCATVAAVASEDISRFNPASLTAILSAFAHVGHVDREFVVAASSALAAPYALADVDTGTLTQMAWVIALLANQGVISLNQEVEVQECVLAVLRQAQRKAADFSPEDLARLFAALAELNAPPPAALVESMSNRLLSTLIPLAQLTPGSLAQVVWAYARLGLYNREVFDAAQAELKRKANELEWQGLAHTVWAYATVREQDPRHRSIYDVNMLATLAHQASSLLAAALRTRPPPGVAVITTTTTTTTATTTTTTITTTPEASPSTEFAALTESQADGSDVGGTPAATAVAGQLAAADDQPLPATLPSPPEVQQASLMTILLSFANLSHHDTPLFDWAGKWLAGRLDDCTAQDLVVMAYAYSRVKHPAPELMLALASAVPKVVDQFDGDDLVYLATLGPSTTLYSEGLAKAVFQRALDMCDHSPTALEPAILLDLARCCAATTGYEPDYYEVVQRGLLRAVNAAQVSTPMDDMSTHCGATNALGLQK